MTEAAETANNVERLEAAVDVGLLRLGEAAEQLADVFTDAKGILERRDRAATLIGATGRMFVRRKRYCRAKVALKEWRIRHSVGVLRCIRAEIVRQKNIEKELERMRAAACAANLRRAFLGWAYVLGQNEQRKRQLVQLEAKIRLRRQRQLEAAAFRGWWEAALGPRSRRSVARRSRQRAEEARSRLQDSRRAGDGGLLVTALMVRMEMNREAVATAVTRGENARRRLVLTALGSAVALRRRQAAAADDAYRRRALRRIVRGWRRWAFANAEGLARRPMAAYRPLGVRYNAAAVDGFARRRCLRATYTAWSSIASRFARARRLGRGALSRMAQRYFVKWHGEAMRLRRIRQVVMAAWTDAASRKLGVPFRAWFLYVDRARRQKGDQERLVRLFRRARNRRCAYRILRGWRHQALYGRVEGLYSRPQLVASLSEQKEHSARLAARIVELSAALEGVEAAAAELRGDAAAARKEAAEHQATADRLGLALHHAEQELVRAQGLLDAAAAAAPGVHTAVVRASAGFGFAERSLEELTKARDEKDKRDAEEDFKRRLQAWLQEQEGGDDAADVGSNDLGEAAAEDQLLDSANGGGCGGHENSDFGAATAFFRRRAAGLLGRPRPQTSDAETQIWTPVSGDSEAGARAALAAAALARGVPPPMLPRELALLDRARWALEHLDWGQMLGRLTAGAAEAAAAAAEREQQRLAGFQAETARRRTALAESEARLGRRERLLTRYVEEYGDFSDEEDNSSDNDDGGTSASKRTSGSRGAAEQLQAERDAAETLAGVAEAKAAAVVGQFREELMVVCGLCEFIRKGDLLALPASLQDDWRARPDAGLAVSRHGPAGQRWRELTRAARAAGPALTWHDARLLLVASAPAERRTATPKEGVDRRIAVGRVRAEAGSRAAHGGGSGSDSGGGGSSSGGGGGGSSSGGGGGGGDDDYVHVAGSGSNGGGGRSGGGDVDVAGSSGGGGSDEDNVVVTDSGGGSDQVPGKAYSQAFAWDAASADFGALPLATWRHTPEAQPPWPDAAGRVLTARLEEGAEEGQEGFGADEAEATD